MKKTVFILGLFCSLAIYAQDEQISNAQDEQISNVQDEQISNVQDEQASNTQKTQQFPQRIKNNLLVGSVDEFWQITLEKRVIVPEKSVVFNLGYDLPWMHNFELENWRNREGSGQKSDRLWNLKVGTAIEAGVDFRYQFQIKEISGERGSRRETSRPSLFAVGAGLGVRYFQQSTGFYSYSETFPDYIDSSGDKCRVDLNYKDVKECIRLAYLDIPLYLEIGQLSMVKTSAYFKLGVKASLKVYDYFAGYGTYSATGYYPQWDLKLGEKQKIEVLGYKTEEPYNSFDPGCKLSPFVLWGSVAGGINIPFSSIEKNTVSRWIFRIGLKADYSLMPISEASTSPSNPNFPEAVFRLKQSNLLGSGNGARIFSVGITAGIIFGL